MSRLSRLKPAVKQIKEDFFQGAKLVVVGCVGSDDGHKHKNENKDICEIMKIMLCISFIKTEISKN